MFASNCELVNLLEAVCKKYDWNKMGRRVIDPGADEKKRQILFDNRIYKLHGDLEHEYRKINYFAFDKLLGGKSSETSKDTGGVHLYRRCFPWSRLQECRLDRAV